ncbi:glycine N-acyltransferase [Centroberyx affinis]|uniref:glycine N-acyltransferase n=1 Tax=Centroberyx affinis TaxID=166261 RepID=UPI003A5BE2C6
MELTGEQLKVAETQLRRFLPQSQQVYSHLVLRNRLGSYPINILVDHWPDFSVIVCQPQYEQKDDLFKDSWVFAIDEAILKETIRKANVLNWTKYLCFAIDLCHEETVKAVASERNVSGSKVAVCHKMKLEDISNLPSIDSSGVSLGSLEESHVGLVNQTWKFGQNGGSGRMLWDLIAHFPSCCVLDAERQPVAWILTDASCAMGVLYTLPEHRGKGYAKLLVSTMAKKLHAQGFPVYCFIEEENLVSYRLFTNLGFTEDPSYRAAWFVFNSS